MAAIGINFRSTAGGAGGAVVDGTDQDYALVTATPRSKNGFSWAWTSISGLSPRDRTAEAEFAPELAGCHFKANTTETPDFVVTLPAPGDYDLGIALGDVAGASQVYCRIHDDTTLLAGGTIALGTNTTAGNFLDIAGTPRSAAQWKAERTTQRYTFATNTLRVKIGVSGGPGSYSHIAHLYVAEAGGGTTGPTAAAIRRHRKSRLLMVE